jgi:hypothetical protein
MQAASLTNSCMHAAAAGRQCTATDTSCERWNWRKSTILSDPSLFKRQGSLSPDYAGQPLQTADQNCAAVQRHNKIPAWRNQYWSCRRHPAVIVLLIFAAHSPYSRQATCRVHQPKSHRYK